MNDLKIASKYTAKAANAHSRDIPFSLSFNKYKKLISTKKCYYTGILFDNSIEGPLSRTLERKDNRLGYTDNNTVVCILRINKAKGALLEDDILCIAKQIIKHRKKTPVKKTKNIKIVKDFGDLKVLTPVLKFIKPQHEEIINNNVALSS